MCDPAVCLSQCADAWATLVAVCACSGSLGLIRSAVIVKTDLMMSWMLPRLRAFGFPPRGSNRGVDYPIRALADNSVGIGSVQARP